MISLALVDCYGFRVVSTEIKILGISASEVTNHVSLEDSRDLPV
jgi:hypothetical protein